LSSRHLTRNNPTSFMSLLDSSVICFDSDKTFSGRSSGYQSQICSSIQRPDATRFILSGGASGVQLIQPSFSPTILPAWNLWMAFFGISRPQGVLWWGHPGRRVLRLTLFFFAFILLRHPAISL
jgi:hypothetical protein